MNTYPTQKNPFLDRRPYVYAIMWTEKNMAYVGLRHAKGCHPGELWKRYFTSSKYVAEFRAKHGEPDHIEIIDTFLTAQEAIDAEDEIISDFELHKSVVFLNKNCSGAIHMDEEVCARLSAAMKGKPSPMKGKASPLRGRQSPLKGRPSPLKGYQHTAHARANMSASHLGQTPWNKGIPRTDEEKDRIGASRRGKPNGRKGIPSGRKGIPSPKKGVPSGRKGIPSPMKGQKLSEETLAKRAATRARNLAAASSDQGINTET